MKGLNNLQQPTGMPFVENFELSGCKTAIMYISKKKLGHIKLSFYFQNLANFGAHFVSATVLLYQQVEMKANKTNSVGRNNSFVSCCTRKKLTLQVEVGTCLSRN